MTRKMMKAMEERMIEMMLSQEENEERRDWGFTLKEYCEEMNRMEEYDEVKWEIEKEMEEEEEENMKMWKKERRCEEREYWNSQF